MTQDGIQSMVFGILVEYQKEPTKDNWTLDEVVHLMGIAYLKGQNQAMKDVAADLRGAKSKGISSLTGAVERICELTLKDLQNKTVFELLASASEELGELSRELKIAHRTHGNSDKVADEGPRAEATDLAICALALYYAEGGTVEELEALLHNKLNKWQKRAGYEAI